MIRNMEIGDVASVFNIDKMTLKSNWTDTLYRHELLDLNTRAFVYEIDNHVVGFIIAKFIGGTADLLQIAVLPEFQKKKIGFELAKYAIDLLTSQGIEDMVLEVNALHLDVINFYKQLNFEKIYTRRNYYGRNKDALIMKLKVK